MKYIKQSIFPLLLFFALSLSMPALAQDKKESAAKVEKLLQNRDFIFKAQSAMPLRGSMVQLTSPYDIILKGDTLQTFLPYFGRAYSGSGYNSQGGIRITSTEFVYDVSDKRKKRWNVMIKPQDNSDVQQMILNVSESGYASLQVISTNRDPISFNGYVTERSIK